MVDRGSIASDRCFLARRGPFALVVLAAALAACVRYQPRPIAPERTLTALEARGLDSSELTGFLQSQTPPVAWPPPAWDVDALTLAAFYYHPDLDAARANWAAARAAVITAGERPNPAVGVEAGYNSTTPPSQVTPWILTLPLDFTVETAGKRGHRIASARGRSEAARFNVATVGWQVRSRVRRSLLELHGASGAAVLLERQLEIQQGNVALIARQLAAGAISAFEMGQARLALNSTRLSLHDARRRQAEARVQLAGALGVTVGALEGVTLSFDRFDHAPDDLPPPALRREALLNRADVLGALANYEATQAQLRLEIARQYPDVHLGPGYQMDQAENKWTLGLSGLLPLLNRNRGAISETMARRTEAAAHFTGVQSRAIEEIDAAIAGYQASRAKNVTAEAVLDDLRKQEGVAQRRWRAGEISKLELGTLQLEIASSELARFDALVQTEEALGRLEDSMQRPADLPAWTIATPPRGAPGKEER